MPDTEQQIEDHLETIAARLTDLGRTLVVAESCTGGMLAARITDHAGCSQWFKGGFVTYQTSAKMQMLGIPAEVLAEHPPVSETVALAMVENSLSITEADYGIAVTGIAGPDRDETQVDVGTLWVAWGDRQAGRYWAQRYLLHEDRAAFRRSTCVLALAGLCDYLTAQV